MSQNPSSALEAYPSAEDVFRRSRHAIERHASRYHFGVRQGEVCGTPCLSSTSIHPSQQSGELQR